MPQSLSLPVELLYKILNAPALSKSELGCLRLVNRELSNIVTNRLFATFTLRFTKQSFTSIQQLSRSRLSPFLKYFIYSLEALNYDQDQKDVAMKIMNLEDSLGTEDPEVGKEETLAEIARISAIEDSRREGYDRVVDLESEDIETEILAEALPAFENMESISFIVSNADREQFPNDSLIHAECENLCARLHTFAQIVLDSRVAHLLSSVTSISFGPHFLSWRYFDPDPPQFDRGVYPLFRRAEDDGILSSLSQPFTNLRTLDFSIISGALFNYDYEYTKSPFVFWSESSMNESMVYILDELLQSHKETLETLCLHVLGESDCIPGVDFGSERSMLSWKRLRTLRISGWCFRHTGLVNFLYAHKETLRDVEMGSMTLIGPTQWEQVFEEIDKRGIRFKRLKLRGRFGYMLDSNETQTNEDYNQQLEEASRILDEETLRRWETRLSS